jgi:hypothetical protein
MPRRISQVFGVPPSELKDRGVFNGFVDVDAKLYVDPHLLGAASTPELRGAYDDYCARFTNILKLLRSSKTQTDVLFRRAAGLLEFPEDPIVALGYSSGDTAGSGIGSELAFKLALTAKEIISAGIDDPTIFDLVGLIEEGIGPDRISDMATKIIMPRLVAFSVRVASELNLPTKEVRFGDQRPMIPRDPKTNKAVLLLPSEILRSLPIARDWSSVDLVAQHNAELRRRVNGIIGDTWKRATSKVKKSQLREVLLANPELLRDLLGQYKAKPAKQYNFDSDPDGILSWYDTAQKFAGQFPLQLESVSGKNVLSVVTRTCHHFGDLIENNGLDHVIYGADKRPRHERYPQLLFFGIADAYCAANNLDLSREPNAGRGAVDFKISAGYSSRVLVEIKYSTNPGLVSGYTKQLATYEKAEKSFHSVYLILRTSRSEKNIKRVVDLRERAIAEGRRAPDVLVYDARLEPSASKVR